jgi:site-specific DNA-cytosine methylase
MTRYFLAAFVLFAGGGGVECGMVAAGIRPVLSVEHDSMNLVFHDACNLPVHLWARR